MQFREEYNGGVLNNLLQRVRGELLNSPNYNKDPEYEEGVRRINLLLRDLFSVKGPMSLSFIRGLKNKIQVLKEKGNITDDEYWEAFEQLNQMSKDVKALSFRAKIGYVHRGRPAPGEFIEDIREPHSTASPGEKIAESETCKDVQKGMVFLNGENLSHLSENEIMSRFREKLDLKYKKDLESPKKDDAEFERKVAEVNTEFNFIFKHGHHGMLNKCYENMLENVQYGKQGISKVHPSDFASINWWINEDGAECEITVAVKGIETEDGKLIYLDEKGRIQTGNPGEVDLSNKPVLLDQKLSFKLKTKLTENEVYETKITDQKYEVWSRSGVKYGSRLLLNNVKRLFNRVGSWFKRVLGIKTKVQTEQSSKRPEPPSKSPTLFSEAVVANKNKEANLNAQGAELKDSSENLASDLSSVAAPREQGAQRPPAPANSPTPPGVSEERIIPRNQRPPFPPKVVLENLEAQAKQVEQKLEDAVSEVLLIGEDSNRPVFNNALSFIREKVFESAKTNREKIVEINEFVRNLRDNADTTEEEKTLLDELCSYYQDLNNIAKLESDKISEHTGELLNLSEYPNINALKNEAFAEIILLDRSQMDELWRSIEQTYEDFSKQGSLTKELIYKKEDEVLENFKRKGSANKIIQDLRQLKSQLKDLREKLELYCSNLGDFEDLQSDKKLEVLEKRIEDLSSLSEQCNKKIQHFKELPEHGQRKKAKLQVRKSSKVPTELPPRWADAGEKTKGGGAPDANLGRKSHGNK